MHTVRHMLKVLGTHGGRKKYESKIIYNCKYFNYQRQRFNINVK